MANVKQAIAKRKPVRRASFNVSIFVRASEKGDWLRREYASVVEPELRSVPVPFLRGLRSLGWPVVKKGADTNAANTLNP